MLIVSRELGVPAAERGSVEVTKDRAHRFAIRTTVRYRFRSERAWFGGVTENISSSGVLFRGEQPCVPGTKIEMSLTLPGLQSGGAATKVSCQAVVVWTTAKSALIAARMMSRPRLFRK